MKAIHSLHRWIWPQRGERLKAIVVYGLVGLVVAAAVLLTSVRLLFAAAPSLVSSVEAMVSAQLQVPVRIGELDARLHRLRPGLVLRDVEVGDTAAGVEPVQLAAMTLAIAPWASLEAGEIRLHALEASGLDIKARHRERGWQLSGLLPVADRGITPETFLQALRGLPVDHLLLRDARVELHPPGVEQPLTVTPVTLRWRSEDSGDWRFAIDARVAEAQVQARLSLPGAERATAQGFVSFSGIGGELLRPYLPPGAFQPDASAVFSGRAWLALDDHGLEHVTAELTGDSLGLLDGALTATDLRGRIERTAEGWAGRIQPQRVQGAAATPLDVGPLAFDYHMANGQWRWAAERLPLTLVEEQLVPPGRLPAEALLAGELTQIQGVWQTASVWRVTADLRELGFTAADPWPQLQGGELQLIATPAGGEIRASGLAGTVGPQALLREPVTLSDGSGRLLWWRDDQGQWRFRLADGQASWQGVPLTFDGQYWIEPDAAPFVDLNARVGGADIEKAMNHLPVGVMHEKLVAWLDRAVTGGRVDGMTLRLFGQPQDFPFVADEGLFDLRLQLADIGFRFNQQWPALRNGAARLQFRNQGMTLVADRGQVGNVTLRGARASMEDLWRPRLQVDTAFAGALAEMQAVLRDSPLLAAESPLADVDWRGDAELGLSLYFPFERRPLEVEGQLQFTDAELSLPAPAIRLTGIRGEVGFDDEGVRWNDLRARFRGRPLVLQASTETVDGESRIQVTADTRLALADWPGLSGLASQSDGAAAWRIAWDGPGFSDGRLQPGRSQLEIRSGLEGASLDLPLRLSKRSDEAVATRFSWRWSGDGAEAMTLAYGDRLQATAERDKDEPWGAVLHFGATEAATPQAGMTRVTGELPRLRLGEISALAGSASNGQMGLLPSVQVLDLSLMGLDVSRWRLGPIQVTGSRAGEDWNLDLAGAAEGRLQWSAAQQRANIELAHLRTDTVPVAERTTQTREPAAGPDVRLEVAALSAADILLGRFRFSRINDGLPTARANLALRGEDIDLNAEIAPDPEALGGHRLRFDLFTDDAGSLLEAFGLPRAITAGKGSTSGNLTWIGPMLAPALPSLQGQLEVDLRNGALPAVEPGAGRALGLFSLSVLPRRLGLDFSDVVGEGLQFDALQGTWRARAGRLRTDDLTLSGPSMDLALRGETDLVRRRYDQEVTVTPHLSSALTFFGGLAGGPAAAVMLFLTRDMIEPGVERLTAFEYRIYGPWEDPQFELLSSLTTAAPEESGDE